MKTLYDISNGYNDILNREDLDEETINDTLESIEGAFEDKTTDIIHVMNAVKHKVEIIDNEIKRLQARKKPLINKVDQLKEYLRTNMIKINCRKIDNDLYTLSLRKGSESVFVEDVNALPDRLVTITRSANKAKIKEELNKGDILLGCSMVTGEDSLMIK